MRKIKVDYFDAQELAASILDKTKEWENEDIVDSELEDLLYEEFNIDFESFHKLLEHLMPYSVVSKSELTDTLRVGFVDHLKGYYIVKTEITAEGYKTIGNPQNK